MFFWGRSRFAGQYLIGVIRQEMGGYTAVLAAMAVALLTSALIVLSLSRVMAPRPVLLAPSAGSAG